MHTSIAVLQMRKLRLFRLYSQPKDKHLERLEVEFLLKLYVPFAILPLFEKKEQNDKNWPLSFRVLESIEKPSWALRDKKEKKEKYP